MTTTFATPDEEPDEPQKRGRRANNEATIYLGNDGKWHGRVIVGIKDDGSPDRRHVERKTEDEVKERVRELMEARDKGNVQKPGQRWTVETWLTHWLDNIVTTYAAPYTFAGYRTDIRKHLIPGLGKHRLVRLEPEHIERFYKKLGTSVKPATVHHVHRTLRAAIAEAERRGHVVRNVAKLARAPKVSYDEDDEVEPYTVDEVRALFEAAADKRNAARWVVALALGLRQGEALGMRWEHVDFARGVLRVRRSRLRPEYRHGCPEKDPCGRMPGYCPKRENVRAETKDVKSRAGKRTIGLPDEIAGILRGHREVQERERTAAGDAWQEGGWVFTDETGRPLNTNTDYHRWKELLKAAGLRDGRLHDARHTAATVLLILKVDGRVVMELMGWSTDMRRRYQHVIDPVRREVADDVGRLLWGRADIGDETARGAPDEPSDR